MQTINKFLFTLLILIPTLAGAQISIGFGVGAHYAPEKTAALGKLSITADVRGVVIQAAQYISLTRNIDPGSMFGGTIGYDINGFIPVAGYFYNLKSNDHKEMNSWIYGGGLRWKKFVGPNGGGISAEVLYLSNNNITACFGITYQF